MKKSKIHFMGIGGSALSGVAIMAKRQGFEVTGCDLEKNTAYLKKVEEAGIKVFGGHSEEHLQGVDILAITPAVEYLNKDHPEYRRAKKLGILRTWDKFLGEYLLKDKESICITGTSGKSTTTSLASVLFEKAGLDPSAIIGAKVTQWNSNYRIGKGKHFIIEADDFYEKFLSYKPSTIILNNIEFDHPDFFESEDNIINSYFKFVKLLRGNKNLILNQDSPGNKKLLDRLGLIFLNSINLFGFTLTNNPQVKLKNTLKGSIIKFDERKTVFRVYSNNLKIEDYELYLLGTHNVSNALGVIVLGKIYGIKTDLIKETLASFKGTARRLEFLGEKRGIKVYDDYAHHPTKIAATLSAVRQKHPQQKLWVIVEPHSYSRTKALLDEYKGVFQVADKVVIGPIFKARDKKKFGVNSNSIVKISDHDDIKFIPTPKQIAYCVKRQALSGDVVVVMGAGESYKWAREILRIL